MPLINTTYERVNILLEESTLTEVRDRAGNSSLVRDLIEDKPLSMNKITLSVSKETEDLYLEILDKTGASDSEIEPCIRGASSPLLIKSS